MRPKGSGYKTQHWILDALRFATKPVWFEKIVVLLNGDRNKASRNLKVLVEKGLVDKRREGHKMVYSVTEKGKQWTDWEGKIIIEKLFVDRHPEEIAKQIEEWARRLPRDFEELDPDDPQTEKLWKKCSEEIGELFAEPDMRTRSLGEIIGWAKELRKVRRKKRGRQRTRGAREPKVEAYTKKPSSFKPKE